MTALSTSQHVRQCCCKQFGYKRENDLIWLHSPLDLYKVSLFLDKRLPSVNDYLKYLSLLATAVVQQTVVNALQLHVIILWDEYNVPCAMHHTYRTVIHSCLNILWASQEEKTTSVTKHIFVPFGLQLNVAMGSGFNFPILINGLFDLLTVCPLSCHLWACLSHSRRQCVPRRKGKCLVI